MENLAIAYVTCDKYEHVWEEWYDAFLKHWDIHLPKYFCGEAKECPFDDFKQIYHVPAEVKYWTTKLRAQIEQIPEENIFIWLDDMPQQFNITIPFALLYDFFLENEADALRIIGRESAATYEMAGSVWGSAVYRLAKRSPYLVSYSPNIYKKKFLLEILQYDESPWASELNGSLRFWRPRRKIYAYHIDGWYINRVIQ